MFSKIWFNLVDNFRSYFEQFSCTFNLSFISILNYLLGRECQGWGGLQIYYKFRLKKSIKLHFHFHAVPTLVYIQFGFNFDFKLPARSRQAIRRHSPMPWLARTLININIYTLNKKIYNHHAYNIYAVIYLETKNIHINYEKNTA